MTRERLDDWCRKGILGLVTAALVFGPLATGAVRPLEFLVIEGLTMGALLLWSIRCWLTSGHRLLLLPVCWAVLGFVIYAMVRYSQSDLEYVARRELIRILVYAVLFFVILNNLTRQESTMFITYAMVFLATVISIYAVYQFATNSHYVWHFIKPAGYGKRASGTYICPNHLAGFLEMVLPLGLACTIKGRNRYVFRLVLGYGSFVMLAGVAVTVSRGGWLAAAAGLLLLFALLLRKSNYRPFLLGALGLIAASAVLFYMKTQSMQRRMQNIVADDAPDDIRVRLWLWKPAVQMWKDHFWLGAGPGLFDYRFAAYRPIEIQARPGYVHNDYLNTLADYGLVGFAFVGTALASVLIGIIKSWKFAQREPSELGNKPSDRAAFMLGATAGLAAMLLHSIFDFNMHIPANAILCVALLALLSGHLRYATERYWANPGLVGPLAVTLVSAATLAYFGQEMWRQSQEYFALEQASLEKSSPQKRIAALEKAAELEPTNFGTTYAIGETLRQWSWAGDDGYEKLARKAIDWFRRGITLNPFDAYNYIGVGMCLDWLDRHDEAASYFEQAVRRDPNNYYVLAHQGWHFVQVGDYHTAKAWFEKSTQIKWRDNPIAFSYLGIIDRKLRENAKNRQLPA